jgi:hypothetical protein
VLTGETYIIFRRYNDLLKLHRSLSPVAKTLDIQLPEFPPKQLRPSEVVIARRQKQLEAWLQGVCNSPPLLTSALSSLELPEYLVFLLETATSSLPTCRLTEPEMLDISFVESSPPHNLPPSSPFCDAVLSHPPQ